MALTFAIVILLLPFIVNIVIMLHSAVLQQATCIIILYTIVSCFCNEQCEVIERPVPILSTTVEDWLDVVVGSPVCSCGDVSSTPASSHVAARCDTYGNKAIL